MSSDAMDPRSRQLESLYARQASAWLEALRHPGPGDEAGFVRWLKESPRNVRDFLLMLSLDRALCEIDAGRLRDIDALIAQAGEARAAPAALERGSAPSPGPRRGLRPPMVSVAAGWRRASAIAAGTLLAVAGGWAWISHSRLAWTRYETAVGEQRTFELQDGSVVYLNTHSRLAVRFDGHTRDVRLQQGEALFRVHHDTSHPFRVYTDDAIVQAVGTQFDVYRREDGTDVSVIEGRVKLVPSSVPISLPPAPPGAVPVAPAAREAPSRLLGASEQAHVSHAGSVSIHEVQSVTDTVAWRERRLVFNDRRLDQIVSEFNRYRTSPIRLEGAGVSDRVFTGVFDADDADSLIEVLARDPALAIDKSPEGVVVRLK